MAEAFAVGAGVVAFIQLADRIISICKFYIEAVRDTPHDLRIILIEVSSLRSVLENLHFLAEADATATSTALLYLSGPQGALSACNQALSELMNLFPADHLQNTQSPVADASQRRPNFSHALKILAWPLKSNRAKKLLSEITQHKATITLALSTESRQDLKDIKRTLAGVESILTDAQRDQIYKWLEHTNPSDLHNKSCDLHEKNTGCWVLRHQAWEDWCAGRIRFLWIHGIPGAGKTVLASFLIQHLPDPPGTPRPTGSAYYYCYFGHNQDETLPFLKWLVSQLCRQACHVPTLILSRFKGGQSPSITELLDGLAELVLLFEVVYVVLDAVDESKEPRTTLLGVLKTLATDPRFKTMQLLATSREYFDITSELSTCSVPVCIEAEHVEADIRTYVQSMLRSQWRFAKWPEELRKEVEDGLAIGAKGMFRWAVCQLDMLRRQTRADTVRAALRDLPETLDETYERIFHAITDHERTIVQRTLALICGHPTTQITIDILLGLIFESWTERPEENQPLCDTDTLQDMCGCLIGVSTGIDGLNVVTLAHFTVREFLYSARTWNNTSHIIRYFRLNPEIAGITFLLAACRGGMALEPGSGPDWDMDGQLSDHCLFYGFFALTKWEKSLSKGALEDVGFQFLNPIARHHGRLSRLTRDILEIRFRSPPANIEAAILTILLCSWLEGLTDAFLDRINVPASLQTVVQVEVAFTENDIQSWRPFTGKVMELFRDFFPDSKQFAASAIQRWLWRVGQAEGMDKWTSIWDVAGNWGEMCTGC